MRTGRPKQQIQKKGNHSVTQTTAPLPAILVIEFHGRMDSHSVGQTYDTLMKLTRSGQQNLIVDLSGVAYVTRAGVRGLIVAAKMLEIRGRTMRICGSGPRATELLIGLGYRHLLKLDRSRAQSLAILASSDGMATSIAEILTAPAYPATPATVVEDHRDSERLTSGARDRQDHATSERRAVSR